MYVTYNTMRSPYPWFGAKNKIAHIVWQMFGNVPVYIEPFAGTLAVLLARPGGMGFVEIVNDKNDLITNFWRAVQHAPTERVMKMTIANRQDYIPIGVFLDPPYNTKLCSKVYKHNDMNTSDEVRDWAIQHGNNPDIRIALCGLEGEHEMPCDWHKFTWYKSRLGLAGMHKESTNDNNTLERIWFSPSCLHNTLNLDM